MMHSNVLIASETSGDKVNGYLWAAFIFCFLANVSGGLISTLMSVYLPDVVRSLSGDVGAERLGSISAYINALYLVGWAIGGFAWGWIGDTVGRARGLSFAAISFGLFTCLIHYAPTWEFVVAMRFLSGFACGGILVLTPTLLSEIWPKKSRSIILGIDSIGFPVGIFSSGLVTVMVDDWRGAFFAGVLPLGLGLLAFRFLNESDSWKDAKQQSAKEAIHYTPTDRSNLFTGAIIFSSMLIGLWGMFSWIPTWVQSLLDASEGQSQRGIAMMLLGAGGLSGGFISGFISNALGVRRAMMFCFTGCIITSALLFGLNTSFSQVIYVELAVLAGFFGISQGLLSIYIPQLFPTSIRGFATGFCFNIGRFVTACAVFFVGVLVATFGGYGNTLLAFTTIFIAGLVAVYVTKDNIITKQ